MVRNHLEEVKKMCHLPEGVFPIAGLVLVGLMKIMKFQLGCP